MPPKQIMTHLGNDLFCALTGACSFGALVDGVAFKIDAGARDGINTIEIRRDADGSYDLMFLRDGRLRAVRLAVPGEQLQDVFTEETGFPTTLGVTR